MLPRDIVRDFMKLYSHVQCPWFVEWLQRETFIINRQTNKSPPGSTRKTEPSHGQRDDPLRLRMSSASGSPPPPPRPPSLSSVFLYYRSLRPQSSQKTINPWGPNPALWLIHKQPIVMQSDLALHLIFTYLNTSPLRPPNAPPPPPLPPPPSTDFVSQLWNETVAFGITAEREEQRERRRFFFPCLSHSLTSFPVCSFGRNHLFLALCKSSLITTSRTFSGGQPDYHILGLLRTRLLLRLHCNRSANIEAKQMQTVGRPSAGSCSKKHLSSRHIRACEAAVSHMKPNILLKSSKGAGLWGRKCLKSAAPGSVGMFLTRDRHRTKEHRECHSYRRNKKSTWRDNEICKLLVIRADAGVYAL